MATQLQRAFAILERMSPQLASARDLADWMDVPIQCAYRYVQELKRRGCIEVAGGTVGRPLYRTVRAPPPGETRGRPRRRL